MAQIKGKGLVSPPLLSKLLPAVGRSAYHSVMLTSGGHVQISNVEANLEAGIAAGSTHKVESRVYTTHFCKMGRWSSCTLQSEASESSIGGVSSAHPNVAPVLLDQVIETPRWVHELLDIHPVLHSSTSSKGAGASESHDASFDGTEPRARVIVTTGAKRTARQYIQDTARSADALSAVRMVLIASDIAEGAHHLMQHGVDLSGLSLDHVIRTTEENEGGAGRAVIFVPQFSNLEGHSAGSASAMGHHSERKLLRADLHPELASRALGTVLNELLEVYYESSMPGQACTASSSMVHLQDLASRLHPLDSQPLDSPDAAPRHRIPISIRDACAALLPGWLEAQPLVASTDGASTLVIDHLVGMIRSGRGEAMMRALQALALVSKACSEGAVDAMEVADVAPCLARLPSSDEVETTSTASAALSKVSHHDRSPTFVQQLLNAGVLPAIVELVGSPDHKQAILAAASLTILLAHGAIILRSIEIGVLPALIAMLHSGQVDAREASLNCLASLSTGPDAAKSAIKECNVLAVIVGVKEGTQEEAEGECGFRVLQHLYAGSAGLVRAIAKTRTMRGMLCILKGPARGRRGIAPQEVLDIVVLYTSASQRMRDAVVQAKAVPYLAKTLRSSNASMVQSACIAVHNLCVKSGDGAHMYAAVHAEVLPALIKLMLPCSSTVSAFALEAVHCIFRKMPRTISRGIKCGVLLPLTKMLDSTRGVEASGAAGVLSALMNFSVEYCPIIINDRALPALVRLLKTNRGGGAANAAQVLAEGCCGGSSIVKAIIKANAIHELSRMVCHEDTEQAKAAARAIASITSFSLFAKLAALESSVIPGLVALLSSKHRDAAENAANALLNLSGHLPRGPAESRLQRAVLNAGAIPALAALMKYPDTQPSTYSSACNVMANLAAGGGDSLSVMVAAGVLPIVAEQLKAQGTSAPRSHMVIVESLAHQKCCSIKEVVIKTGVLPVVMAYLTEQAENSYWLAISAIRFLAAGNYRCKRAVAASGALAIFARLLDSTDAQGQLFALGVFSHMVSESDELCLVVAASGAIPHLIRMMGSRKEQFKYTATVALTKMFLGPQPLYRVMIASGALPIMLRVFGSSTHPDAPMCARSIRGKMLEYGAMH